MEDYHRIMLLASLAEDRAKDMARLSAQSVPGRRASLRMILVTVTVVLLGMIAWWGH